MPTYNVIYKDKNEQIDYGLVDASTPFFAIEKIVLEDDIRKNITDETKRHSGMKAIEVKNEKSNSIESYLKQMEEHNNKIENNFIDLQEKYIKAINELKDLKTSVKFGATFYYENSNPIFIPVFATVDTLEENGEKPIKFSLNFDQKLFAQWTTECAKLLEEK